MAVVPSAHQSAGPRDARAAYECGYRLVLTKTSASMAVYNHMISSFQDYGNRALHDTIVKGFPAFFRHYDARFRPQSHLLTLDYPLLFSLEDLAGIDKISAYLHGICLEQFFLACLPRAYTAAVFRDYHESFQDLILNLPSLVLERLLPGILVKGSLARPGYTEEEQKALDLLMHGASKETLEHELSRAVEVLVTELLYTDGHLSERARAAAADFALTGTDSDTQTMDSDSQCRNFNPQDMSGPRTSATAADLRPGLMTDLTAYLKSAVPALAVLLPLRYASGSGL